MRNDNDNLNREQANEASGLGWQLALRQFFAKVQVEVAIGVLVIVSVLLTLFEFSLESQLSGGVTTANTMFGEMTHAHLHSMVLANEIITLIFIVELTLRYFAASSKRRFFAEFWLDILATIPLFRVFRSARALRLLRLVRLVRLLGVISRLSSHYPYILRRGAVDFLMICGMLLLTVLFGAISVMHFEHQPIATSQQAGSALTAQPNMPVSSGNRDSEDAPFNLQNSLWFSVYTLFAGEPVPQTPRTFSGKLVSLFLMFMGLTIFAIFAGTVSAFMVDRIRMEGRVANCEEFHDHIVICGLTAKTSVIVHEFRAGKKTRATPIVVIAETAGEQVAADLKMLPNVHFIEDDFTRVSALQRAGIQNAQTCLVLSDTHGGRSEQDADARTILAALTVEKINEAVYTCAELFDRNYASHLDQGNVNDYVVSSEYGAHMLAQSSMNRGLVGVLEELLTYQRGNEFHRIPIPASWVGQSFDEKLADIRKTANVLLVAVHKADGESQVNPDHYVFAVGDEVVAISDGVPTLS